jgi:hypothetical protein
VAGALVATVWAADRVVLEDCGNRDLRFIFQDRGAELFISFLGNHDEVKTLLRRGTYR